MLRMQLLEDENVIFVGYKQPHPLLHHILLRVQTAGHGYSPQRALTNAVDNLVEELVKIKNDLTSSDAFGLKNGGLG